MALEFGFNAAILNAGSHSIGGITSTDIRDLESFGHNLSGFGLGLLLFGFAVLAHSRPPAASRQLLIAAVIFPVSIFSMNSFNRWLVYDYIPDQATPRAFQAAQFVSLLPSALQSGMVNIEGVPLYSGELDRPESKAFITLMGPALLFDEKLIQKLYEATPDIVLYGYHSAAMKKLDDAHQSYVENSEKLDIDALYQAYRESSDGYNQLYAKHLKFGVDSGDFGVRAMGVQTGLNRYMEYSRQGRVDPAQEDPVPPGLSAKEYLVHPKANHILYDIKYSHNKKRIKPSHFSVSYNSRNGKYRVDSTEFFKMLARFEAEPEWMDAWKDFAEDKLGIYTYGDLRPNLSKSEFLKEEWTRQTISNVTGLDPDQRLVRGLSKQAFFERYMLPEVLEYTDSSLDRIETDLSKVAVNEKARDQLSALYGPAIALCVSLLFSLLTLGKIGGRVWAISTLKSPMSDWKVSTVKQGIVAGSAVIIVALPMLMTTNSLARSGVIESVTGDSFSPTMVKAMRWTLDVEPLIYPFGNDFLPNLTIGGLNDFYDPHAMSSLTRGEREAAGEMGLVTPLSPRELQKALHAADTNPGPIDGVTGQRTVDALRQLQVRHKLNPSGVQTPETIKVLNQYR